MTIPIMQFQPLSFEQNNPFLTGFRTGQDIYSQGVKNAFLPGQLGEQLKQQQLANAIAQIQQKYADQMTQADLSGKQLDNQKLQALMPFLGPEAQARINLSNSQSGLANSESQKLQALMKFLPERERADIEKLNLENKYYPEETKSKIAQQQAQANYYSMGGGSMGVDQQQIMGLQRHIAFEHPDWDERKVYQAASAYLDGSTTLPNGENIAPASGVISSDLDSIVKHRNTAQGLNQQKSAAILDNLLKRGDQLMPSASKFAGLAGKSRQTADDYAASIGKDNPDYMAFQIFTKQIVPQLSNQMLITEGGRATDRQKIMMVNVSNPLFWNSNPAQAMKEWNYLTDTFRDSITPIVAKGPAQIRSSLTGGNNSSNKNLKNPKDMTTEELQAELSSYAK